MKREDIDDYKDLDVVKRDDEYPVTEDHIELNIKEKVEDRESLYDDDDNSPEYISSKAEIEMQMEILKDMCIKAKKPMFVSVAINSKVANKDGTFDTEYVTNALIPYNLGVKLHNDLISSMLLVMQGVKVRSDIPIEMEMSEEEEVMAAISDPPFDESGINGFGFEHITL